MIDETRAAVSVPPYDDFEQNLRSIEQYVDRPIDSLSLKELASEADRAIGLASLLGKTKLRVAVYLGRIFNEAKEKLNEEVGHGDWVQWYQSNIQGLALRTAEEYMRLARFEADGELDLENAETANMTISGALKQFSKTRKKQQSTTGGGNGLDPAVQLDLDMLCRQYEQSSEEVLELFHVWMSKQYGLKVIPVDQDEDGGTASEDDEELQQTQT